MKRPSWRIEEIYQHIIAARFLDGCAALDYAHKLYLDEQAGFSIPESAALRLAEKTAGIKPLQLDKS